MSLLAFPAAWDRERATVHVWAAPEGGFEIAHESRSGGSWGGFEHFPTGQTAIAAAYQMAREVYDGADVSISPAALADVPVGDWFGGEL